MSRRFDAMKLPDFMRLCVELQCRGVTIDAPFAGRSGGAGPAEGQTIILGGRYLNVPTTSWYVQASPYRIENHDDEWRLYRDEDCICAVSFPRRPDFYNQISPAGLPFQQVALLHGSDCFASTVYQDCLYWNTPLQCRFCGIGLSLQNKKTLQTKDPDDLARAAAYAQQHDAARHVTLTSGAWPDEDRGLEHMCTCIREIKKRTSMPVHAQIHPPRSMRSIDLLRSAGADTLGIHIEVCDTELFADMMPGKAALGLPAYTASWEYAVSVFGVNQVSSFLLAGLGENAQQFLEMVDHIARLGVFPYVLPLRPIPGSLLAGWKPPEPAYMASVYVQTARILKSYNLSSQASKAGCIRCGVCSCLSLFEDEPVS
jgi:radical SAM protein (TIGR04043 family)